MKNLGFSTINNKHHNLDFIAIPYLNPFRAGAPFWVQSTWSLTGLSPNLDLFSKVYQY